MVKPRLRPATFFCGAAGSDLGAGGLRCVFTSPDTNMHDKTLLFGGETLILMLHICVHHCLFREKLEEHQILLRFEDDIKEG